MPFDLPLLVAVAVIFGFAGWIKGVIGLGLPTIATGLMGVIMLPAQAAAIVVIPAMVTNIWQMLNGPHLKSLLIRLWPFLTCILIGTIATAGMITRGNVQLTVTLLGIALIGYSGHALLGTRLTIGPRAETLAGSLAGIATGIISGTTGVFVVPGLPFLQAIELSKNELVQAIGIMAFTAALALALGLGVHGGIGWDAAIPSSVATLAGLAGMWLGQILRERMSLEAFRRWVLIGLLGLGILMAARSFT